MDPIDFRFQRHLKLWEEKDKAVKRTMIAGLFFAFLLSFKILIPFVDLSENIDPIHKEVNKLRHEQKEILALDQALNQVEKTLSKVQETIITHPWMKEKDKLINKLRGIRERSPHGGSWPEYQKTADHTIRTIKMQVKDLVIKPLEESLQKSPQIKELLPELSQGLIDFRKDMDQWEQERLGKQWYRTLFMKDREMRELTYSLEDRLGSISSLIRSEQLTLDMKRQALAKQSEEFKKNIQEKEDLLDELEREMQNLLPESLRGILSIKQMIQLFPYILLGLFVYVMGTAHSLSKHYEFVLEKIGLSKTDMRDASASSVLTITRGGCVETAITLMIYLLFTLAVWYFFEKGCFLLDQWLSLNDSAVWVSFVGGISILKWVGRVLFVLMFFFVVFYPLYRKRLDKEAL